MTITMGNPRTFLYFLGFILFFLGWLNILTGVILIFTAEDTIIATFGLETMVLEISKIDKSDTLFHGMLRVAIGFIVLIIANSILFAQVPHNMFRPHCRDCLRVVNRSGTA